MPRRARHSIPVAGPIDLRLTLTCGQAFRWRPDGAFWSGIVEGAEARVALGGSPREASLEIETTGADPGPERLARYFRLDEDPRVHLADAGELLALPGFPPLLGLRLLRQDPWETLASFIASAAANIRKITGCVEGLASRWGEPIEGSDRHGFPKPGRIARAPESELRATGLGFRAPYLKAAAALVADPSWSWERLRTLEHGEARGRLMELPGVGPKVADCVLLFGLGRLEAYPVDRWIRRATRELSARRDAGDEELERWAARLGPGRGYLQQLLFHLRRTSGPLPPLARARAKRRAPA